jgi:hypothetical protein
MRRFTIAIVVVALLSFTVTCGGGTFFISATNGGVSFFTISGTVSVVQVTIIDGGQVTVVTLMNTGNAQSFNFCGNVASQFPTDAFVKVSYRPNVGCDTVLQVFM